MMKITSRMQPMASEQDISEIDGLINSTTVNPVIRCLRLLRPYLKANLYYRIPDEPGAALCSSTWATDSKTFCYVNRFYAPVIQNLPLLPVEYVQPLFAFSVENVMTGMMEQPLRLRLFMVKDVDQSVHSETIPTSDQVFYDFIPQNFAHIQVMNKPACYFCKLQDIMKTKLVVIIEKYCYMKEKEFYQESELPAFYQQLLLHSNDQITTPQYIGCFSVLNLFAQSSKARFSSLFESSEFSVQPHDTYINLLTQFYQFPKNFRGNIGGIISNAKKLKPVKGLSVYLNCALLNYGAKTDDGIIFYKHVYPQRYINCNFESFTAETDDLTDESLIRNRTAGEQRHVLPILPKFVLKSNYQDFRLLQTYQINSEQFDYDIYDAQLSNNFTLYSFELSGIRTRDRAFIKVELLSDVPVDEFYIYGNNERSDCYISAGLCSYSMFCFTDQVKINYPIVLPSDNYLSICFSVHTINTCGLISHSIFNEIVKVDEQFLESTEREICEEKETLRFNILQNSLFYPNQRLDRDILDTVYSLFDQEPKTDKLNGYANLLTTAKSNSFFLRENLFLLLIIVFAHARLPKITHYEYIHSIMLLEVIMDQIVEDKDPEAELIEVSRFYVQQLLKCQKQPKYYEICGQWMDSGDHCYSSGRIVSNSVRYDHIGFLFCVADIEAEIISVEEIVEHSSFLISGFENIGETSNFELLEVIKRKRLESVLISVIVLQVYYTLREGYVPRPWEASKEIRQLIEYMLILSNDEEQFPNFTALAWHIGYIAAHYLRFSEDCQILDEIFCFGRNIEVKFVSAFALFTAEFYCKLCKQDATISCAVVSSMCSLFNRLFQQVSKENNSIGFSENILNNYFRFLTVIYGADAEHCVLGASTTVYHDIYDVLTVIVTKMLKSDDVERARIVAVLSMSYLHKKYGDTFVEIDVANGAPHLRYIIMFASNFFSRTKEEEIRYFQSRNNSKRKQYINCSLSCSEMALIELSSVFKNRICHRTILQQQKQESSTSFIKNFEYELPHESSEARMFMLFNFLISDVLRCECAYLKHLSCSNFWEEDNLAHLSLIFGILRNISGLEYLNTDNCVLCRKLLSHIVQLLIELRFYAPHDALTESCDANIGVCMQCFFKLLRYSNSDLQCGELVYYLAVLQALQQLQRQCIVIQREVYEFVLECENPVIINYLRFQISRTLKDEIYIEEGKEFSDRFTQTLMCRGDHIRLNDELMFIRDSAAGVMIDIISYCDAVNDLENPSNEAFAIRACSRLLSIFPSYMEMKYDVIELIEAVTQAKGDPLVGALRDIHQSELLHAPEATLMSAMVNLFSAYAIIQGLQRQQGNSLLTALFPEKQHENNAHFLTLLHNDFLGKLLLDFPFGEMFLKSTRWPNTAVISQKLSLSNLERHLAEAERTMAHFGCSALVGKIIILRSTILLQTQDEKALKQAYFSLIQSNAAPGELQAMSNRLKMKQHYVLEEGMIRCQTQSTELHIFSKYTFESLFYSENRRDLSEDVFSIAFLRNLEHHSTNDKVYFWRKLLSYVCTESFSDIGHELEFESLSKDEAQSCFFQFKYFQTRLYFLVYQVDDSLPNMRFESRVARQFKFEVSELVLVYFCLLALEQEHQDAAQQLRLVIDVLSLLNLKQTSSTTFQEEELTLPNKLDSADEVQEQISGCNQVQPLCPDSPVETNDIKQFSSSKDSLGIEQRELNIPLIFSEQTIEIDPEDLQISSGARFSEDSSRLFNEQLEQEVQRKAKTEYLGNQIVGSYQMIQSNLKVDARFEINQTFSFDFSEEVIEVDEVQLCKMLVEISQHIENKQASKNNQSTHQLASRAHQAAQMVFKDLEHLTNHDRWQQLHDQLTRENSFNEGIDDEGEELQHITKELSDAGSRRASLHEEFDDLMSVSSSVDAASCVHLLSPGHFSESHE